MNRFFYLIFLILMIVFQSCSYKNQSYDNNTDADTQIEIEQEKSEKNEVISESESVSFRLRHPIIFTILILSSLIVFILLFFLLFSRIPGLLKSCAIDKGFNEILSKLFKL